MAALCTRLETVGIRFADARRARLLSARLVLAYLLGEGLGGVPPEHDRRARHPPPDVQKAGYPAPYFPSGELAAEHCQGEIGRAHV